MPSFFTCLTCFRFLTGLTCLPFLCALRAFLFYELYLPLFFTCLHFLNVLSIFLYGFIFLRAFTCFLEECGGIFQMNLMILLRFLICCHQQHNKKSPQNLNKYTVNGKTCKIDNLIYFTIFRNPKFLYLHLKAFTETYSDE